MSNNLATPEEILLRPKRMKFIVGLIGALTMTAASVVVITDGHLVGFVGLGLFGLFSLAFLAQFHPNCSYLRLTNDGFEVRSLFRSFFYKWHDVENFRVRRSGLFLKRVGFDFSSSVHQFPRVRAATKRVLGSEDALPDNFGLRATTLAELMNEWQRRSSRTISDS